MMYKTDNPILDALRYESDFEDSDHVCCAVCANPIYAGDYGWFINDDWYCDDCAEAEFRRVVSDD